MRSHVNTARAHAHAIHEFGADAFGKVRLDTHTKLISRAWSYAGSCLFAWEQSKTHADDPKPDPRALSQDGSGDEEIPGT